MYLILIIQLLTIKIYIPSQLDYKILNLILISCKVYYIQSKKIYKPKNNMKPSQNNLYNQNIISLQFQDSIITCSQGNKAPYVYVNRKCNFYPFACENKSCQCHKQHKKCIKAETSTILQNILQGQFSSQHISTVISKIMQIAIDQLSDIHQHLIQRIKNNQKSYQFIGLTKSQVNILSEIKQGQTKSIKCSDLWEVLMNVGQQINAEEVLQIFENKIDMIWQKMEQQIDQFGQKLMRELQLINKYKIQKFENSKVVKTPQDQIKLINFFNKKKLKSSSLLYRASDHGFEIQKFHEKCDYIPNTLTICETQYGKLIGAFTPQEWCKNQKWQFFKDTVGQSFVFSLTHGDKFANENNEAGIVRRNDNTFGLQFGKNLEWDFLLANKANENDRSLANINTGYKNNKYVKGQKSSFERFIGNTQSYSFKAKEWQVWKVEFENQ